MSDYQTVSFTTDYGLADGFVAVCHGVVRQRAPEIAVIDVTHEIPAGDIRRGAAVLAQTLPYLPRGIHVAVVDPGVGTTRKPVAIQTPRGILVGPDNGLLIWAAERLGGAERAVALTNSALHHHPVSRTFHGRDVFAPVAASLACGVDFADAGQPVSVSALIRLATPVVRSDEDSLTAEVLTIDRFGNVQLAATAEALDKLGENLDVGGHPACRGDMFAAAKPNELVVLIDSAGHAAIAVNRGSAADLLGVSTGDLVRVKARPTTDDG